MNDITTAHRFGVYGIRSVSVREQADHRTLRLTRDDRDGFRAIEIHLTESEAAQLAAQLTRSNQ